MIKKLRIKLIAVAMLSLLIVLSVIIGIAGIINYNNIIKEADDILEILAENEGRFPKVFGGPEDAENIADRDIEKPDFVEESEGFASGEFKDEQRRFMNSPELPYESRYFWVLMKDADTVVSVDTGRIAAIESDTAVEYARSVMSGKSLKGFLNDYRYKVHTSNDGSRVIFLDCGRRLSVLKSMMLTSALVALAGLLAVLGLMLLLSKRIVKPVAESYEKQKRFITDAGHEIKTPLAIIEADAEVLEMDYGENEWTDDIKHQTKRLADLTKDLIYLSRMEEEQRSVQMIDFPVSDVVSESVQSFQALAKTKGKSFSYNIQPGLSMYGDEKAILQLTNILLDNALKYSTENGTILLDLKKQGRSIRLAVENSVENMSKENIEHMFDRFYRADNSRNSQTGGYGIGLSIAKAVVEAHKGKISASLKDENTISITASMQG